ncbi:hypothetical protein FACS1894105_04390 [Clostridia bacterium]|nr:hypothetical protein FACS1894105_04390 [Clostridia bacterium]
MPGGMFIAGFIVRKRGAIIRQDTQKFGRNYDMEAKKMHCIRCGLELKPDNCRTTICDNCGTKWACGNCRYSSHYNKTKKIVACVDCSRVIRFTPPKCSDKCKPKIEGDNTTYPNCDECCENSDNKSGKKIDLTRPCNCCGSVDDIKILKFKYEDNSGTLIPLCFECRRKLAAALG